MAKILMFSNRLIIGGPSVHLLSLVEHFSKKHSILLLYGAPLENEASMEDEFRKYNILLHKIDNLKRSKNPLLDMLSMASAGRIIKDFEPDIIHTHTYKPGIIGRVMAKRYGVKRIIHTYHGLIFDSYFSKTLSLTLAKIDKYIAKSTDVIIALSEIQKKQIIANIGEISADKVEVIPLAVSEQEYVFSEEKGAEFRREKGIPDNKILLGMLGRLADVKNVSLAVSIFAELKNKGKINNAMLMIIGDGDQKPMLISQAKDSGLNISFDIAADNTDVLFIDWQRKLIPLYSAMDILMLSSKNEGTPFNIIEAQMMQTVIIAPNVGGIPDIVQRNKTAYLYDNKEELLSSLQNLLENEKNISDMKHNALNFAKSNFSMSRMLNSYEKLYTI
ncbi:MAG: hypothetical protein B6I18_04300 [Bacteroidetes bacterium 4572_112]|nr:MAG: hypothetical protein B6I18_04300 [Bacteroidetes bacterium 4572_112]